MTHKWMQGATPDEIGEIESLNREMQMINDRRSVIAAMRSEIIQKCIQRVNYEARNVRRRAARQAAKHHVRLVA